MHRAAELRARLDREAPALLEELRPRPTPRPPRRVVPTWADLLALWMLWAAIAAGLVAYVIR